LAQDKQKRLALVNMMMTLEVPQMCGISLAQGLSAFQEGLCSMTSLDQRKYTDLCQAVNAYIKF
jgi:hypothetical protein